MSELRKIPSPKTSALVKGTACDLAWNEALNEKAEGREIETELLLEMTEQFLHPLHLRERVRGREVRSVSELRRFSHSLVDQFLRCPRKAEFQYVDKIPSPKTSALVKGTACDLAWNEALNEKAEGREIETELLLEMTEQFFRDDVREQGGPAEVAWGESNARAELDSALRLSKTWRLGLYPDIQPLEVQVELHRKLPSGRDFVGFIDWTGTFDGHAVIGDNKTGGRKFSAGEADKALQPSAYAYLADSPIDFVFARAIDTGKSTSSEAVLTRRNQGDVHWYEKLVLDVERSWEAGIFPTNPTGMLCSPKHCPFYERCQPHRFVSGPQS